MDAQEESFSEYLQKVMREKKVSQAVLARRSGLSPAQVSRLVNGESPPGKNALIAIAEVLHLAPTILFAKAGVLPPMTEREAKLLQLEEIYRNISDDKREEFLRYGEFLREEEERSRGSAKKLNPKTEPR